MAQDILGFLELSLPVQEELVKFKLPSVKKEELVELNNIYISSPIERNEVTVYQSNIKIDSQTKLLIKDLKKFFVNESAVDSFVVLTYIRLLQESLN